MNMMVGVAVHTEHGRDGGGSFSLGVFGPDGVSHLEGLLAEAGGAEVLFHQQMAPKQHFVS